MRCAKAGGQPDSYDRVALLKSQTIGLSDKVAVDILTGIAHLSRAIFCL